LEINTLWCSLAVNLYIRSKTRGPLVLKQLDLVGPF
jgi:hypothetical protein